MSVRYYVRHAHAVWSPDPMRSLSPAGRADAEKVASVLESLSIEAIYSSPHARVRQTVEPLSTATGLPIVERRELLERLLRAADTEHVEDFRAPVRWTWDHFESTQPGGESNRVAQKRIVAIDDELELAHRGDSVVVATHGSILALLLNHHDPSIGFGFWERLMMPDIIQLESGSSTGTRIVRLWPGTP